MLVETTKRHVTSGSPVVLITASSAGLGVAIAKVLSHDHRVVINYFSRPEKAVIKSAKLYHHKYALNHGSTAYKQMSHKTLTYKGWSKKL
jgi:NAD(P)-dependent dehydrogenase (short-subunit alcohol dehydrogenase family)